MKIIHLRLLRMRTDMLFKIIIPAVLLLIGPGAYSAVFAETVEIQSIQIIPVETSSGKRMEITGTIKAKTPGETREVNIVASLTWPDHSVKSFTWKKITIKAGEARAFLLPKEFETKMAGVYKVDFGVYAKDMTPLNRLSKNFTVEEPSQPPVKTTTPESATRGSGKASEISEGDNHFGLGVTVNTVNSAVGATFLVWPFKYVGLQGSYTMGAFTTAEGRLLARFPIFEGFNPYVGVGFASVSTERTVDVINIKTTFKDSGVSGVLGVEIPLGKHVFGYVEVSGAAIDLKKEVTDGVQTGTAKVEYSPITVGFSIAYFLF
jgi:hypothetical protein